jgi:diaminopimelate decarboxylase
VIDTDLVAILYTSRSTGQPKGVMLSHRSQVPTVVGPSYTPLEVLADRTLLTEAQVGDLVVVFQSGAYGASASPQQFLAHPPCAEALV